MIIINKKGRVLISKQVMKMRLQDFDNKLKHVEGMRHFHMDNHSKQRLRLILGLLPITLVAS
jgi:hypothetical protein